MPASLLTIGDPRLAPELTRMYSESQTDLLAEVLLWLLWHGRIDSKTYRYLLAHVASRLPSPTEWETVLCLMAQLQELPSDPIAQTILSRWGQQDLGATLGAHTYRHGDHPRHFAGATNASIFGRFRYCPRHERWSFVCQRGDSRFGFSRLVMVFDQGWTSMLACGCAFPCRYIAEKDAVFSLVS